LQCHLPGNGQTHYASANDDAIHLLHYLSRLIFELLVVYF
jgi:hypothetical protein